MIEAIKQKHAEFNSLMGNGRPNWLLGNEDKLSNSAWLALVAVPWLLQKMESDRGNEGKDGYSNSKP